MRGMNPNFISIRILIISTVRKAIIWNAVLVTGIVLRLLVGRPACLQKDYDGIWATPQYFQVTVFSIAACMGMIGFVMAVPMTIQMFGEKWSQKSTNER